LRTPAAAAALGAAYALAGRAEEATPLIAGAVEEFRRRRNYFQPAFNLLCLGRTCCLAGRIDEAAGHAQKALALSRRPRARGHEAQALCFAGEVASARGSEDAEGYYCQALALAEPRGMRPLVAHCHFALGKMHHRLGNPGQAQEHFTIATAMYREMGLT